MDERQLPQGTLLHAHCRRPLLTSSSLRRRACLQGVALRCLPCRSLLLNAQTYRQHLQSKVGCLPLHYTAGSAATCMPGKPAAWCISRRCHTAATAEAPRAAQALGRGRPSHCVCIRCAGRQRGEWWQRLQAPCIRSAVRHAWRSTVHAPGLCLNACVCCVRVLCAHAQAADEDEGETHAERLARLKRQVELATARPAEAAASQKQQRQRGQKRRGDGSEQQQRKKGKPGKRERAEAKAGGGKAGSKADGKADGKSDGGGKDKHKHSNAAALRRKKRREQARTAAS